MTEATSEHIEIVLDNTDFDKIHKGMKAVDWIWSSYDRTPTADELKNLARTLLTALAKSGKAAASVSKGGFRAKKYNEIYSLEFVFDKSSPLSKLSQLE